MSRQGGAPLPSGYGTPPPVVPPNPGRATLRRAPGGLLLPFLVSTALLVLSGTAVAALGGRGEPDPVPGSLLDARAAVAHATAQAMRKGLDEAYDDLAVLADTLAVVPDEQWEDELDRFAQSHDRYQVLYLLADDGEPQRVVGDARPRAELLPRPLPTEPGLTRPLRAGARPALLAYAPVPERDLLLVGRYDVQFFRPALEQLLPGTGYLVDEDGAVVGSTSGFRAFQRLPTPGLAAVAERSDGTEPSGALLQDDAVTAFSPVVGDSPAGRLGLSVLSSVQRQDLALPGSDARRLALLLGSLTVLLGLLSMLWFYFSLVRPARGLAREAERLAFGDRTQPVRVVRYDEIGLTTRALERCRVLLQNATKGG